MKKELIELGLEMHTEAAEQNCQQELHLQSDLHLELLKMLLNTKITSFAIPADLVVNGDKINELWQDLMEIRPPDLNTIVWNCNPRSSNAAGIRPFFNSLIAQPVLPPKLVVLRLQLLECNSKDLSNIADRLPNLRSV